MIIFQLFAFDMENITPLAVYHTASTPPTMCIYIEKFYKLKC